MGLSRQHRQAVGFDADEERGIRGKRQHIGRVDDEALVVGIYVQAKCEQRGPAAKEMFHEVRGCLYAQTRTFLSSGFFLSSAIIRPIAPAGRRSTRDRARAPDGGRAFDSRMRLLRPFCGLVEIGRRCGNSRVDRQ